ncbi:MAG: site-specific DNA-methyltransferase [Thaumarchaeota archaeon]|nr:site-specific DNA-methyltransferase [Nitrososphaerota archaeon]
MRTTHRVIYGDSATSLGDLRKGSVDLVVTSPPYPMIEMWDDLFGRLDPKIRAMLDRADGDAAYEAMHRNLDKVWKALDSRMKRGGAVCVNIGDATRTVGGSFRLYPNHSRVSASLLGLGYHALPEILWRKHSNKPNKFMGSGMLPPGAYVTQEHEYVMLFRKGDKREFLDVAKQENRRRSAFFWEERNRWFSDIWDDLKGDRQDMKGEGPRERSAAYPFELACRLVSMFSVRGDMVVDPFGGTGMTTLAAVAAGRNSVAIEIDPEFRRLMESNILGALKTANEYNRERLRRHVKFATGNHEMKYINEVHGFPVMTRQETSLEIPMLTSVKRAGDDTFEVEYDDKPVQVD